MNAQDALDLIKTVQQGEFEDARLEVKRVKRVYPNISMKRYQPLLINRKVGQ